MPIATVAGVVGFDFGNNFAQFQVIANVQLYALRGKLDNSRCTGEHFGHDQVRGCLGQSGGPIWAALYSSPTLHLFLSQQYRGIPESVFRPIVFCSSFHGMSITRPETFGPNERIWRVPGRMQFNVS